MSWWSFCRVFRRPSLAKSLALTKAGVLEQASSFRILEPEAEGPVQGHPGLHREFNASTS